MHLAGAFVGTGLTVVQSAGEWLHAVFKTDSDHSCSEEMDWRFIINRLKLRPTQTDVFTYTNYVTIHDRNWYDNEHPSDNTTKDIDPFNQKRATTSTRGGETKKKKSLLGLKYRIQVPHLSVCLKQFLYCEALKAKHSRASQWRTLCTVCRVGLPAAVFVLM